MMMSLKSESRPHLDINPLTFSLPVGLVKCQDTLHRGVVQSPSIEILKETNGGGSEHCADPAFQQGLLSQGLAEVPSNLNNPDSLSLLLWQCFMLTIGFVSFSLPSSVGVRGLQHRIYFPSSFAFTCVHHSEVACEVVSISHIQ